METAQQTMEEARIKKVGVLSVANICAVIYAFIGFLLGIFFAFLSTLFNIGIPAGQQASLLSSFFNFGYLSIIIFPIIYGIFGFVGGAIMALFIILQLKSQKE